MINLLIIVLAMFCATVLYVEGRNAGRSEEIARQERRMRNLTRLRR